MFPTLDLVSIAQASGSALRSKSLADVTAAQSAIAASTAALMLPPPNTPYPANANPAANPAANPIVHAGQHVSSPDDTPGVVHSSVTAAAAAEVVLPQNESEALVSQPAADTVGHLPVAQNGGCDGIRLESRVQQLLQREVTELGAGVSEVPLSMTPEGEEGGTHSSRQVRALDISVTFMEALHGLHRTVQGCTAQGLDPV